MRFATLLCRASALFLAPSGLLAQTPSSPSSAPSESSVADSLGFRRGQWGFLLALDRDFRSLGVQRFRSPRTAWMLDLALGGSFSEWRDPESGDPESRTGQAHLTARVGLRRYSGFGTRAPRTHRFVGAGVSAYTSFQQSRDAGDDLSITQTIGSGLFGEVGLQHRVASFLALGGTVTAAVNGSWYRTERRYSDVELEGGARSWSIGAFVGNPALFGIIYF